MIRIPNLTLSRLLDHAEELLRRAAIGRTSLEGRAYAADAEGRITVLGFPVPADDAGRQALGAILQSEMRKRQAIMSVLALEAQVALPAGNGAPHTAAPDRTAECIVLEGQQLRPVPKSEVRLLAIERQGRRIIGLQRLSDIEPSSGAEAGGPGKRDRSSEKFRGA